MLARPALAMWAVTAKQHEFARTTPTPGNLDEQHRIIFDALLACLLVADDDEIIQRSMTRIDDSQQLMLEGIADLGSRMGLVEDQQLLNEAFNVQLKESLSGLEDIDYAKAISDMNLQMVALQAAQQTYSQTKDLNLFNYL